MGTFLELDRRIVLIIHIVQHRLASSASSPCLPQYPRLIREQTGHFVTDSNKEHAVKPSPSPLSSERIVAPSKHRRPPLSDELDKQPGGT